jgi:hypothetical protein
MYGWFQTFWRIWKCGENKMAQTKEQEPGDEMSDSEILSFMLSELDMLNTEAATYLDVRERTVYRWLAGTSRVPKMVFLALELKRLQQ